MCSRKWRLCGHRCWWNVFGHLTNCLCDDHWNEQNKWIKRIQYCLMYHIDFCEFVGLFVPRIIQKPFDDLRSNFQCIFIVRIPKNSIFFFWKMLQDTEFLMENRIFHANSGFFPFSFTQFDEIGKYKNACNSKLTATRSIFSNCDRAICILRFIMHEN